MKRLSKAFAGIIAAMSVAAAIAGCSPRTSFTEAELDLIEGSDSVMYVEVVGIEADSLILRAHNEEFTLDDLKSKAFRTLAAKMLRTVTDPSQDGVGIAAPQVGINRRVIAVQRFDHEGEPFGIFPNARLDSLWGDITHDPEGCLSIPGKRGLVPRYTNIRVSYTDPETLEKVTEEVEGFTAIIFQHEIDHLEGVLYTDKADSVYVD